MKTIYLFVIMAIAFFVTLYRKTVGRFITDRKWIKHVSSFGEIKIPKTRAERRAILTEPKKRHCFETQFNSYLALHGFSDTTRAQLLKQVLHV